MGFKKQFETYTKFNVNIRAFAAISLLPVGDDLEDFVELKKVIEKIIGLSRFMHLHFVLKQTGFICHILDTATQLATPDQIRL